MPTIRITEKTWENLNRVAKEFIEYKRTGFENVLRISPDATVQKLIDDWDEMDKKDTALFERNLREKEKNKGKVK